MPRLNIQERFWTDPRISTLQFKIGRYEALGQVLQLIRLGQHYWIQNESLVPETAFKMAGLSEELFACELAERREEGIYVKGSESNFQWYFEGISQRQEAGKKSAESRRLKYGSAAPGNHDWKKVKTPERDLNGTRTGPERESTGPEPSSSSSSSKRKNTYAQTSLRESVHIAQKKHKKEKPAFDLDSAYQAYPRKIGRKRGLYLCGKKIKTAEEFEKFKRAITNYDLYCKKNNLEPRFIKHFSTFVNEWEDWEDQSFDPPAAIEFKFENKGFSL